MVGSPSQPDQRFSTQKLWLAQPGQLRQGETIIACANTVVSSGSTSFSHKRSLKLIGQGGWPSFQGQLFSIKRSLSYSFHLTAVLSCFKSRSICNVNHHTTNILLLLPFVLYTGLCFFKTYLFQTQEEPHTSLYSFVNTSITRTACPRAMW